MKKGIETIEFLKKREPLNAVLIGPGGLGKQDYAMELASSWLKVGLDDLMVHPDFRFILPENGLISSEKSEAIRNMAKYKTPKKSVCIVAQAHLMTVDCQNKLLKVLEDGDRNLAVIFVSEAPLLDTIMSRCVEVHFEPLSDEALYEECKAEGGISVPALMACNGSKGRYHDLKEDEVFVKYVEPVFLRLCAMKSRSEVKEMLGLTHALREKDKEYFPIFFDEQQMAFFLYFIRKLFYYILLAQNGIKIPSWMDLGKLPVLYSREEAAAAYFAAEQALRKQKKKGMFTKNDFFDLLMEIVVY